jgi:hypothetical protein
MKICTAELLVSDSSPVKVEKNKSPGSDKIQTGREIL